MEKKALIGKALYAAEMAAIIDKIRKDNPRMSTSDAADSMNLPASEVLPLAFPGGFWPSVAANLQPVASDDDLEAQDKEKAISLLIPVIGQMRLARRLKRLRSDLGIKGPKIESPEIELPGWAQGHDFLATPRWLEAAGVGTEAALNSLSSSDKAASANKLPAKIAALPLSQYDSPESMMSSTMNALGRRSPATNIYDSSSAPLRSFWSPDLNRIAIPWKNDSSPPNAIIARHELDELNATAREIAHGDVSNTRDWSGYLSRNIVPYDVTPTSNHENWGVIAREYNNVTRLGAKPIRTPRTSAEYYFMKSMGYLPGDIIPDRAVKAFSGLQLERGEPLDLPEGLAENFDLSPSDIDQMTTNWVPDATPEQRKALARIRAMSPMYSNGRSGRIREPGIRGKKTISRTGKLSTKTAGSHFIGMAPYMAEVSAIHGLRERLGMDRADTTSQIIRRLQRSKPGKLQKELDSGQGVLDEMRAIGVPVRESSAAYFTGMTNPLYMLGQWLPTPSKKGLENQEKNWLLNFLPGVAGTRLSRRLKKIRHDLEIEEAVRMEKASSMNTWDGIEKDAASLKGMYSGLVDFASQQSRRAQDWMSQGSRTDRLIGRMAKSMDTDYQKVMREKLKSRQGRKIVEGIIDKGQHKKMDKYFDQRELDHIMDTLAKRKTTNRAIVGGGVVAGGGLIGKSILDDKENQENSYMRGRLAKTSMFDQLSGFAKSAASVNIDEFVNLIRKSPSFSMGDILKGILDSGRKVDSSVLKHIEDAKALGSSGGDMLGALRGPANAAGGQIKRLGRYIGGEAGEWATRGNPLTRKGRAYRKYWKAQKQHGSDDMVESINRARRNITGEEESFDIVNDLKGTREIDESVVKSLEDQSWIDKLMGSRPTNKALALGGGAMVGGGLIGSQFGGDGDSENAYLRGRMSGMNRYASADPLIGRKTAGEIPGVPDGSGPKGKGDGPGKGSKSGLGLAKAKKAVGKTLTEKEQALIDADESAESVEKNATKDAKGRDLSTELQSRLDSINAIPVGPTTRGGVIREEIESGLSDLPRDIGRGAEWAVDRGEDVYRALNNTGWGRAGINLARRGANEFMDATQGIRSGASSDYDRMISGIRQQLVDFNPNEARANIEGGYQDVVEGLRRQFANSENKTAALDDPVKPGSLRGRLMGRVERAQDRFAGQNPALVHKMNDADTGRQQEIIRMMARMPRIPMISNAIMRSQADKTVRSAESSPYDVLRRHNNPESGGSSPSYEWEGILR